MSMRKRRKHCAGILGRDGFTQKMWSLGLRTKISWFVRYGIRVVAQ